MADYLAFHPKGTSKSLYKAIIDVHHGQYASAFHHIAKGQSLSYDELQAQLRVGPQVALKTLAKTEVLVELQEVIQYKFQPESREHILGLWKARFKRSHADANSWLKRLQVWHLACPTTEIRLQSCYLDCAKLCESSGMHEAAARILDWVTPDDHPPVSAVDWRVIVIFTTVLIGYYRDVRWSIQECASSESCNRVLEVYITADLDVLDGKQPPRNRIPPRCEKCSTGCTST